MDDFIQLPTTYFIDPRQRMFWLYLLSSGLIAVVFTWAQTRTLPSTKSMREYWLHPSALLDYRFFFVSWLIKLYLIAPLLFSAQQIAIGTFRLVSQYVIPIYGVSYETVTIAYTLALFIFSDFTRYWLHRALHEFEFLWAFHRVHHSAEVLNPVTFYRVHPVESLLFGIRYALSAGFITGLFIALFGAKLSVVRVLGINVILFGFSFIGSNLRHSHVYIRFPRWLERVFISPAQHQLHHQYRFSCRNFGGYLAIWDSLFGSLKTTHDVDKPAKFGLSSKEMPHYQSVWQLLLTPFTDIIKRYIPHFHKPKVTDKKQSKT